MVTQAKVLMTVVISLMLCSMNLAQAKSSERESSIPQHLLNKILKKKYQKAVAPSQGKVAKNKLLLPFSQDLLVSNFSSWGVEPSNKKSSINLIPAWQTFKKKRDVVVAVIDTGIDPTHPFLAKNLVVTKGKPSVMNYGIDFSKSKVNKNQPYDEHGHGTHVSGIIKSVYPNVKILALKYYNPKASGQDNLNSTIAALRYAVDQNVDIINYSGGGPEPALEELKILKEAERKGILVVAAAGNEESNIDIRSNAYYPASYGLKNIISVTAHDKDLQVLSSSNWGKKSVDIAAPGYRIRSALPKGRSGFLTGTSQATAFVSGSAALLMSQYPDLTTPEVREILKQSAKQEMSLAMRCSSGGRLDAGKAQVFAARYLEAKRTRGLANKRNKLSRVKKKRVQKRLKTRKVRRLASRSGKIYYRKSK